MKFKNKQKEFMVKAARIVPLGGATDGGRGMREVSGF